MLGPKETFEMNENECYAKFNSSSSGIRAKPTPSAKSSGKKCGFAMALIVIIIVLVLGAVCGCSAFLFIETLKLKAAINEASLQNSKAIKEVLQRMPKDDAKIQQLNASLSTLYAEVKEFEDVIQLLNASINRIILRTTNVNQQNDYSTLNGRVDLLNTTVTEQRTVYQQVNSTVLSQLYTLNNKFEQLNSSLSMCLVQQCNSTTESSTRQLLNNSLTTLNNRFEQLNSSLSMYLAACLICNSTTENSTRLLNSSINMLYSETFQNYSTLQELVLQLNLSNYILYEQAFRELNETFHQQVGQIALTLHSRNELFNTSIQMLRQRAILSDSNLLALNTSVHALDNLCQQIGLGIMFALDNINASLDRAFREISQFDTELDDRTQGLHSITNTLSQNVTRNYITLNSRIEQLNNSLGEVGEVQNFPVSSCASLPRSFPSGHYWVRNSIGSAVYVYCDMTRSCGGFTGGWMQVVQLDMRNRSHRCPSGLNQRTDHNTLRTCVSNIASAGCTSAMFPVNSFRYSRVCGKIKAYQVSTPDGFHNRGQHPNNIDANYVDGIGLSHGYPRQHIWTFAAVSQKWSFGGCSDCRNIHLSATHPFFVGNDFFCDTGTGNSGMAEFGTIYSNNPLWDNVGCPSSYTSCCNFNTPPWFYKRLLRPTTDDIEMRVCRDQPSIDEDIAIESIEIFVQ